MDRAVVAAGNAVVAADWDLMRRRLLGFVARRVANPADVEDVVQDVLLRMAREIDGLRDGDRLDAWAYRVARNAIVDEYRRRGRTGAALTRLQAEHMQDAGDPTAEPVVESDLVELGECLRPLIDRLDEPYRSALTATAVDGHTQAEAAAAAGVSLSGMKSRVQRGRDRLREILLACCEVETSDPRLRGRRMAEDPADGCSCS
jgi:RNA polymerase sigma-70 factor, ECF subfamily